MTNSPFFYTEEQNKDLKRLAGTNQKCTIIAKRLARQWKRSETSLYNKLMILRKEEGKPNKENKVTLPTGLSFDFKLLRGEMYDNHVRLYW